MILDYEQKLLGYLDSLIDSADDDELFAAGYLSGHITLSISYCEEHSMATTDDVNERVYSSLVEAQKELTPRDRELVLELWSSAKQTVLAEFL
ncbi:YfcL family protein [Photobacterium leiognathi]|uniref:YfcL family protein n=1 Tax=Photobacterium leiognathi TaxID=553611 RepID=UPI0029812400|nr:YfcL family protein [Photobacterium leiognathi]